MEQQAKNERHVPRTELPLLDTGTGICREPCKMDKNFQFQDFQIL